MSAEEPQQPSLVDQVAQQAAERAARELAKQALTKLAALLGAKGALIVAAVIVVALLIVLVVVLLVSVAGAAFQSSTAVWPVPVATDAGGNYQASGWTISSRFGWRDKPEGGGVEFHDGIDMTNPQGTCPFGYHCGVPSIFDGTVQYVGWDQAASGDPSKAGGGMLVIISNGQADHQVLYAHLEPYRLYVQLQGRIEDDAGRYDGYAGYQPIGTGELQPDLTNGGIEMTCLNDMPNFIPTRSGPGTVVFLYDRPADCTTTVVWGQRGDEWQGWLPDEPGGRGGDGRRADLRWQTPLAPGQRAQDVALRFRAHLVPPPPPPTAVPTATVTLTPTPGVPAPTLAAQAFRGPLPAGQGAVAVGNPGGAWLTPTPPVGRTGKPRACMALAGGWTHCRWALANIPTERERFATAPDLWVAAAPAASVPAALDDHGAAEGPTVPPEQLRATAGGSPSPVLSPTPAPTATSTPGAMTRPRTATSPRGLGGPDVGVLSQATTAPSNPPLLLSGLAALSEADLGRVFSYAFSIFSESTAPRTVTFQVAFGPYLDVLQTRVTDGGTCAVSGSDVACTLSVRLIAPPTIDVAVRLKPDTPPDTIIQVLASAEDDLGTQASSQVLVRSTRYRAAPTSLPPTPVPVLSPTPSPALPPTLLPTLPSPAPGAGSGTPDCAPLTLVRLPDVSAPNPHLVVPAAASFAAVRAEIQQRTGIDALAVLADVLRAPAFSTGKAGVLNTSWHKAGRAVDLNQGGPFVRVAEGRMFRLYVHNVDVTAIFEAHGWQRIPVRGDTLEWWHYEYHPDGIAWTSAMRQLWDLPTLQAAFPDIDWTAIGCAGGSNTGNDPLINPQETAEMCALGAPTYRSAVETIEGCGPPVKAGDKVYQLDTTLGFVGLSGRTTGPHLHLGLKVRSYDGSYPVVAICTPEWLEGRAAPQDTACFTDQADPLAFLPRAPGNTTAEAGDPSPQAAVVPQAQGPQGVGPTPTPVIADGAPYQLPPPNYPNALVFTPVPSATPVGQYWSPYAGGGRYGGGGVREWFCSIWSGWPWCN